MSANYLKCEDWLVEEETEFYLRIVNRETGARKNIDKFRREKRR